MLKDQKNDTEYLAKKLIIRGHNFISFLNSRKVFKIRFPKLVGQLWFY